MSPIFQTFRQFNAPLSLRFAPNASAALNKKHWVVTEPFVYYVGAKGSPVTVEIPLGYHSDGATIPACARWLLPPWGKYGQACVVHDYLCEYLEVKVNGEPRTITRQRADEIFLEAMIVLNVNPIKRFVMYQAVALWTAFNNIDRPRFNAQKFEWEERYRLANHGEEPILPEIDVPLNEVDNVQVTLMHLEHEAINVAEVAPMPAATYPVSTKEKAIAALMAEMRAQGMNNPVEQAMLLAQVDHESGGFRSMEEGFNYTAKRLMEISRTARNAGLPAVEAAIKKGPMAVAELMYNGRMGNNEPGDGYKYRGRGYIQLTGKDNYRSIGKEIGLDLVNSPDLAALHENAAKIAVNFWKKNVGAKGATGNVAAVTKAVNGGLIGLEDRKKKYTLYLARLNTPGMNANNIA